MVIQLAWLTPRYLRRRSTAWRQAREVLCSASLNRSSKSLIASPLMVSYLTNDSTPAKLPQRRFAVLVLMFHKSAHIDRGGAMSYKNSALTDCASLQQR